jgi:hypothetical protein
MKRRYLGKMVRVSLPVAEAECARGPGVGRWKEDDEGHCD